MARRQPKVEIIIDADGKRARKEVDKTKDSLFNLTKMKSQMQGLVTAGGGLVAGLTAIAVAAKQAFDFSKAGAELIFAQSQFENLSESIGTTADVLMTDMRKATKGMVSDANLVAQASSIMSLGLADSGEGVTKLSTLVTELGWDMNQVILTFANNSTMRLDALGLSISSVTDRARELTAGGMDWDKAFDLAVIEAGEAKLKLLGSSADSVVAPFKRMEASLANIGDSLKKRAAEPAAKLIGTLELLITWNDRLAASFEEASDVIWETAEGYDEYIDQTIGAAVASKQITEYQGIMLRQQLQAGTLTREYVNELLRYKDVAEILTEEEYRRQKQVESLTLAYEAAGVGTANAGLAAVDYGNALKELQGWIGGSLGKNQEKFVEDVAALEGEVGDLNAKIEELELKEFLTEEQSKELEELKGQLQERKDKIDEVTLAHDKQTKSIIWNLIQQRAAMMGLEGDEKTVKFLTDLAYEWGLVDEATRDATFAADDYLLALGTETGALTGASRAASSLALGLREIETRTATPKELHLVVDDDPMLGKAIAFVGKTHNANIKINVQGSIPKIPSGTWTFKQGSGKDGATALKDGIDTFVPPGNPNDSFRANLALTGGERLTVTPAHEVRKGGSSDGAQPIIYVLLDGREISANLETRQGSELRRSFGSGSFRKGGNV